MTTMAQNRHVINSSFTRSAIHARNGQLRDESGPNATPTRTRTTLQNTIPAKKLRDEPTQTGTKERNSLALSVVLLVLLLIAVLVGGAVLYQLKVNADEERAREALRRLDIMREGENESNWFMLLSNERVHRIALFISEVSKSISQLSLCILIPLLVWNLGNRYLTQRTVHEERLAYQADNMFKVRLVEITQGPWATLCKGLSHMMAPPGMLTDGLDRERRRRDVIH